MNIKLFHINATKKLKKIGIISKFTIIKSINFIPDFKFVLSLFRLEDPYRDDSEYVDGLFYILKNFTNIFKNTAIKIYFDDSVLLKDNTWADLFKYILSLDYVELIKYDFPQFKKSNSFYHESLFGMFIRVISIFNFSDLKETTINIDIDYVDDVFMKEHKIIINQFISNVKKSKSGLLLNTCGVNYYYTKTYNLMTYKSLLQDFVFPIRFFLPFLTCSKKIDSSIFIDFMKCMRDRCDEYNSWICNIKKNINCENKNISKQYKNVCKDIKYVEQIKHSVFIYDTDEFFVSYMADRLIKRKIYFDMLFRLPSMIHYHFFLYQYMFMNNRIIKEYMDNFYKFVLGKKYSNNINLNFQYLDKMFLEKSKKTQNLKSEINNIYLKNIYTFIKNTFINGYLIDSIKDTRRISDYKKFFEIITMYQYEMYFYPKMMYNIKYFIKS